MIEARTTRAAAPNAAAGQGVPDATSAGIEWLKFVTATESQSFAQAWLGFLAHRIGGVTAAAVLVESAQAGGFAPMAVWPTASPDLARLSKAIEACLRERRGQVVAAEAGLQHVAYPLMRQDQLVAVVALEVQANAAHASLALQEIHWGSAWVLQLLHGRDLAVATAARDRLSAVLDQVATLSRHQKLQQALFESVNGLRLHFSCARVALGLVRGHRVLLTALSEAAEFDRHSVLSKAYVDAMTEAMDVGRTLRSEASEADAARNPVGSRLADLRQTSGSRAVVALPVRAGGEVLAVVVLERVDQGWSDQDLEWLDAFSALACPLIRYRIKSEQGVFRRLQDRAQELSQRLFGEGFLTWKLGAVVLLALVIVMALPITYRVSAKTVIEGEVHRVLAAPFDGFLQQVHVRPGDEVRGGQVMASLDDRELRMEEARWTSERDQNASRLREAMANHDLAAIAQIQAQLAQADAQLGLVRQKLERSQIRAPFEGVVVAGDLAQELGASVEMGKRLFEVAPLESYRVVLQVDERDIRHVRLGQRGSIVMTGFAGDPMDFDVNVVTPVATAEDGQNFFRVEAHLHGELPRLRPGMEGVGKIETERRSVAWVLMHRFTDWLRLTLWGWLP